MTEEEKAQAEKERIAEDLRRLDAFKSVEKNKETSRYILDESNFDCAEEALRLK